MKTADFEQWLNSFLNFEKLPQKNMFWLDTMEHFSSTLGNINSFCPSIHIAGSKGKGSTSAFISSILTEAGFKTGLYTSPHILTFLERITENQKLLPMTVYEKAADILFKEITSPQAKEYLKDRPITWFELITLFSFLCFKEAGMNAEVYEVGLGGRLDATNVIKPSVCCIGPIELEHTEYLGDTVEKIAAEKGGIIKQNVPVIVAEQTPAVKEVFKAIAAEKNSQILFIDEICQIKCAQNYTFSNKNSGFSGMNIEICSELFKKPLTATLKLPGNFQAQNAAMAAVAVKKAFPQITEEQIEKGLSKASLPARFEIIPFPQKYPDIPLLILDGAHTPRSINFTLETLAKLTLPAELNSTFNLLFACAADKDVKDIVPMFKNKFKNIYLTKPGNVKQSDITGLKNAFIESDIKFDLNEDFIQQIKKALTESSISKTPLLVTGSFYLVSEVKKYLASHL